MPCLYRYAETLPETLLWSFFKVMLSGNDPNVEGFVDCVRLSWAVHMLIIQDGIDSRETASSASSNDIRNICSCMETIFSNNVFQFMLDKVLQTAAYQVCIW